MTCEEVSFFISKFIVRFIVSCDFAIFVCSYSSSAWECIYACDILWQFTLFFTFFNFYHFACTVALSSVLSVHLRFLKVCFGWLVKIFEVSNDKTSPQSKARDNRTNASFSHIHPSFSDVPFLLIAWNPFHGNRFPCALMKTLKEFWLQPCDAWRVFLSFQGPLSNQHRHETVEFHDVYHHFPYPSHLSWESGHRWVARGTACFLQPSCLKIDEQGFF